MKKVIGYADRTWSVREAIKKQVQIEDALAWSKRKEPISQYVHKPSKFKVTKAITQAFASSFQFISSLPKL